MRTCIFGGPRTGKSTLAQNMSGGRGMPRVHHTDDLIELLEWSEVSRTVVARTRRADAQTGRDGQGLPQGLERDRA
jgi:adenylate kinase family enzyme